MDMSFLIKSMLPPGVTVEMLQAEGKILLEKIALAAQCIQATHALVLEQNAMLRQVIEQSQGLDPLTQQKDSHVDQTHAVPLQTAELDGRPIGEHQPLSAASDGYCDICGAAPGDRCLTDADNGSNCRNCDPGTGQFIANVGN